MLRKTLSLLLAVTLIVVASARPTMAGPKEEKAAAFTEKVKDGVARLGTGTDAQIEVRLRDKTKLKGFISAASATHFVVTDAKTGAATSVDYPQVAKVRGHNLSTGAKIAIGAAIGAGVALLVLFLIAQTLD